MDIPAGSGKVGPAKFAVAALGGSLGLVAGEVINGFIPPAVAAMGFWRINVAKVVTAGAVLVAAGLALSVTRK